MRTPAPAWWAATGYAATLAVLVAWPHVPGAVRRRRTRACAFALLATLAAWIVTAPSTWRWPWRADGWLRVVALDVGQGDATLIEFPDGRRWLVDAGGLPGSRTYDIGERVVAPTLWARGTGRLDRLVLTHGDPDHVGGAASVVDDFGPTVLEGVPVPGHATLAALRARAEARRRSWGRIEAGATWVVGGVTVRAWHPPPPDWERQRVRNDDSVVLELRYGGVSIVLPGDVGAEVERALAARMPPAPRRVLKAAHHGSATSTSDAWLDALRPEVVVISCGRENRYGHPAGSVLDRLRDRGIQTLRTDQDGQVVVETDGNEVRFSTVIQKALTTTKVAKGVAKATKEGSTPTRPQTDIPGRR
jgi:competence protein ComEC